MQDRHRIYFQSKLPLYHQLMNILMTEIVDGKFEIGDYLPSERELEEQYQVSRITVRQALGGLVTQGILTRKQGKGTLVTNYPGRNTVIELMGSLSSAVEIGETTEVKLASVQFESAGKLVGQGLDIDDSELVLKVVRIRL